MWVDASDSRDTRCHVTSVRALFLIAMAENEPPSKRKRLSHSLKKSREKRFGRPVDDEEVADASKGVVPANTVRRNAWAVNNLMSWAKARNEENPGDLVPVDLLECRCPDVVNKWLCRFVMETRQESGEPYPPKSIYALLCGLHHVQKDNKIQFNFLDKTDVHFQELHKTLDTVCSQLHTRGVGAKTNSAAVITLEDEDLLWRQGILGCDSPRVLFHTVFFYVGLFFCLRGGQEQRSLTWENFRRVPEDPKVYTTSTYYEYFEFASKNNQHRFRDIHCKNKCVKAYANCESDKCVVKILDFFRTKMPNEPRAFYLRPLEKTPTDPDKTWFVNTPVGVNTLNTVVSKIFEKCDSEQTFTYSNHSLRATAASRLFERNVPEKIIAERTGHRSLAGLRAYERTTKIQDQAASSSVVSLKASPEFDGKNVANIASSKSGIPALSGTFHGCTFNF